MASASLVIPGMAARGEGSVILTASLSSMRGNKSIGLHALSKAGLAQLARNFAVEGAGQRACELDLTSTHRHGIRAPVDR